MSPLMLHPDLEQYDRETIENRISLIQVKRMSAAVTFYAGVNAKTKKKISIFERRIAQELERLHRDFQTLDKNIAKVEARARKIDMLRNQVSQQGDALVDIPEDDDDG